MNLKDKVIIFLGNTHFKSEIQATSLFIARNLAKDNKVFFIDYPLTLKDYFRFRNSTQLSKYKEKFSIFSDGLLDTDLPNLKTIITPPIIPINFLPEGKLFRWMLKINESIIAYRIKKILKANNILEFIYINSFNFHYPNVGRKINPMLTIYQCVDPMIVPYDMRHGIKSEEKLARESDLIICTSKALYNEKKLVNPNTYFVPNATDSYHLYETLNETTPIHEKLKNLPKPIIGYLGTIERRINYELILEVIRMNTDKTFVFAGPVENSFVPELLQKMSNVHIIGSIPYNEVPLLLNSFTVAIIPFKKDDVSDTIFPIKLFEYLSAGKPVIATDFNPDLKDFTDDLVEYCNDANTFSRAINDAIVNNDHIIIQKRKELAKRNTWKNRTKEIVEIINSHLSGIKN
ncbi:glycosyltransferase [Pedobacter sp. V48]|uniref:glycosyltransferase n=1 Tax=Pedobacter sp. V48 TaxID=509635 RepID=UPI0003E4727E|nr:glycosyltransferase [Pedobacter sp. V48]ETZ22613.1 hypothetical protein N824_22325 [Pedobacter sp. V48]